MCPPVRPRIMGCGGAVGKRWHLLAGRPDVLGRCAVVRYRPPRRPLSCAVHVRATRRHRVARPSLADPALERRTLLAGGASGEAHATAQRNAGTFSRVGPTVVPPVVWHYDLAMECVRFLRGCVEAHKEAYPPARLGQADLSDMVGPERFELPTQGL